MSRKRVLVVCPGAWDRDALARPAVAADHDVVFAGDELVSGVTAWRALTFDVFSWVRRTAARHRGVDGVIGTGDYPGCMLAAGIAEELGLPGPRARSVVVLSHKHYSREIQRAVVPDATPRFEPLDPFSDAEPESLRYPYFLEPVKGTMSIRARLVASREERRRLLRFALRERVQKTLLLKPFQQLLDRHTDGRVPAHYFIAESPLSGEQVTVDGFVQDGAVTIMGVVDSLLYPGTQSFERFQYPSRLPHDVQERMCALVRTLVAKSGLDQSCFNVELFYEPKTGAVHVIEVNPRMSYQFGDLYERVDGVHTYELQMRIALGQPARWAAGRGRDRVAASFVMRRFSDARVLAVPGQEAIADLRARYPGTTVKILCAQGDRLSEHDQDVGSFRYAIVNMGAQSEEELHARYAEARRTLHFELEPA